MENCEKTLGKFLRKCLRIILRKFGTNLTEFKKTVLSEIGPANNRIFLVRTLRMTSNLDGQQQSSDDV